MAYKYIYTCAAYDCIWVHKWGSILWCALYIYICDTRDLWTLLRPEWWETISHVSGSVPVWAFFALTIRTHIVFFFFFFLLLLILSFRVYFLFFYGRNGFSFLLATMFASSVLTGKGGNRYRATLNEIQNHLGQLKQPTSISGASYFYKFHTCWNDLEPILTWTNRFEPDEIQIPQF